MGARIVTASVDNLELHLQEIDENKSICIFLYDGLYCVHEKPYFPHNDDILLFIGTPKKYFEPLQMQG